jgi:hypothetical protein
MAVSCQVTSFTKDSTGVNGATQDVTLNFTPKAIIVFSPSITNGAGDTFQEVFAPSYGFSDGTNQACWTVRSEDAQATSDTGGSHRTDAVIGMQNATTPATVQVRGSVAFGTNKVTFTWTVNDANALHIYVIAFGGTDITNAKVNTVSTGRTTTGTQDYTGLGFNPTGSGESILFTLNNNTATNNANESICSPSIGCAVSTSKRWAISNCLEDARTTTDTWRYQTATKCLSSLVDTTGALDYLADFSAWITDGFTLNYTDAPASATDKFSYLVINGGKWDAGTKTIGAGTGLETVTLDTALVAVRGVCMAYHSTTTVDSVASVAHLGIAAVDDALNQGWMAMLERTALADSQNISRNASNTRFIAGVLTTATTPFTPSIAGESTISSFGTNQFVFNITSAFGAAYPIPWWAVGDSGVAPPAGEEEIVYQKAFGSSVQSFTNTYSNPIFG